MQTLSPALSLKEEGLPTPQLERWKYTNIVPLAKNFGGTPSAAEIAYKPVYNFVKTLPQTFDNAEQWLIDLLEDGLPGEALWHLGGTALRDGLVIDVPAGKRADKPVEVTTGGVDGCFYAPRTIIRLGARADLTVIEYASGQGACWNNSTVQIEIGPDALLRHVRIQENDVRVLDTRTAQVKIARGGSYESFTLNVGGALSRTQLHAVLAGEGASCAVYGLNLLRGRQHADMTVEIEHSAPRCSSRQFVRSVLDGQAHGVFQGKATVHPGADGTDATQLSNALLLALGAEMDNKPELEIHADDVKCSHGATVGQLDENPLFYLRSRGIPEAQARALLIGAFVDEVVDKLADETVKEIVKQRIDSWLNNPPSHIWERGHRGDG